MVNKKTVPKSKHNEVIKAESKELNFFYADGTQALKKVNLPVYENKITALIGPSGCGKSTLLRCFNRMNDLVDSCNIDGQITLDIEVNDKELDVVSLRERVGMVFQKPNPFPKSLLKMWLMDLKFRRSLKISDDKVEEALKGASLWKEAQGRLHDHALSFQGGNNKDFVSPGHLLPNQK